MDMEKDVEEDIHEDEKEENMYYLGSEIKLCKSNDAKKDVYKNMSHIFICCKYKCRVHTA